MEPIRPLHGNELDAWLLKPVRQSQLQTVLATAWAKRVGVASAPSVVATVRSGEMKTELAALSRGAPIRVLVAEDNPVNQKVTSVMLQRLGVRADVAANGKEALHLFQIAPYDLILMDCQTPEMDGYAATREIRYREMSGRRVPIIAMTAEAMADAREVCLKGGMDDHLAKPVRLEDLFAVLRKFVAMFPTSRDQAGVPMVSMPSPPQSPH